MRLQISLLIGTYGRRRQIVLLDALGMQGAVARRMTLNQDTTF